MMKIRIRMNDLNFKQRIAEAKDTDIVTFLKARGYEPSRVGGLHVSYCSPLRDEKNPSFSVNLSKNTWVDYGSNLHGDCLDLIQEMSGCSFKEAIDIALGQKTITDTPERHSKTLSQESNRKGIEIIKTAPITDTQLMSYLSIRGISLDIARMYCKQVHLKFPYSKSDPEREHLFIGFPNNSMGFELRNHWGKLSNAPKDITTHRNVGNERYIIEGFMDYLSILSYFGLKQLPGITFVLNGISNLKVVAEFIKGDHVFLYVDSDEPANKEIEKIEGLIRYTDCRTVYEGKKDFNEFMLSKIK